MNDGGGGGGDNMNEERCRLWMIGDADEKTLILSYTSH